MPHTFVGRSGEQAVVAELLNRARSGHAQRLLIRGEAGVGKTRMLHHVVDSASRKGFHCLYIEADHVDGQVPFAALRLANNGDRAGDPDGLIAAVLASADAQPLWRRRATVNDGLRKIVEGWTDRGPILLAVDDMHAADASTAVAILYVMRHVRNRRLFAVVTTRPARELAPDIGDDLRRFHAAGELDELELGPFGDEELGELVEAILGEPPSASLVAVLRDRSGGLPFFAVELILAMRDAGVLVNAEGAIDAPTEAADALPRHVTTAVLHRVFGLGDDARRVASAAAVLGEVPLSRLPLLANLTGLSADATDVAFDRLVEARFLTLDSDRYRFGHAIVREALYVDIGPAARRRWHREIADELRRSRSSSDAGSTLETGRHVLLSGGGIDAESASLLAEAGDALLTSEPRAAAGWYRVALSRLPPGDRAVVGIQLGLSRALDLDGQHADASRLALSALADVPPGEELARATLVATQTMFTAGHLDRACELLDAAIADPETRSPRLLLHRAQMSFAADRSGEAQRYFDEATELGLDERTRLVADRMELHLHCASGRFAEGARLAERLRQRFDTLSGVALLNVRHSVGSVTAYNFDPSLAIADVGPAVRSGVLVGWFTALMALASERLGRLDEALAHASAALAASPADEHDVMSIHYLPVLIACRAERGDVAGAEEAMRIVEALAPATFRSRYDCAIAHLWCVRGEPHRATEMLAADEERERANGRINALGEVLARQVDVALAADDAAGARLAADKLSELPGGDVAVAMHMWQLLASALTGDDADVAAAARGYAQEHHLALDAARALAAVGSIRGDAGALTDAYIELDAIGAIYRMHHVAGELRRLGKRPPARPRQSGELTAVESELASLVARGLTNREIAREMNLSPKTIEVYLTRIYAKLGLRSRVELAVAVRAGSLNAAVSTLTG